MLILINMKQICPKVFVRHKPSHWICHISYVIAVIFQYICQIYLLLFGATLICFGVGMYLFTVALANDIKNCSKGVQNSAKAKNRRVALMHFSKFLQYHSDARQLKDISNR